MDTEITLYFNELALPWLVEKLALCGRRFKVLQRVRHRHIRYKRMQKMRFNGLWYGVGIAI